MCILLFIADAFSEIFKAFDIKYTYLVLAESSKCESVCLVLPAKWKLLRWLAHNAWKFDYISITREEIHCVRKRIDRFVEK